MPEPIVTLNEESLRGDLRELVRQTVEDVFVKTVVSWGGVARKTFRPGTASFHVRQGMPLSAFS